MAFTYTCPDCESGLKFHHTGCQWDDFEMWEIERAYIDIISRLTAREEPWPYDELRDEVAEFADTSDDGPNFASTSSEKSSVDHPGWTPLHDDCLHYLYQVGRAYEGDDGIQITEPSETQEGVIPSNDPLRTVFEYGPIDGCKDYAVYTMVSWCELIELDWEQTVAFIDFWLNETGRWDGQSWGERSPKQLAESKKHIHDKGMGWGEYPEMAKTEMEASSAERRVDAEEMAAMLDREVLSAMDV